MNIATIVNFGARFGTRVRSVVRRTVSSGHVTHNNCSVAEMTRDAVTEKLVPLTALWSVNPQNGRVECHWSKNAEEIAVHQSLPVLERFGLILAASQQNRTSNWVH